MLLGLLAKFASGSSNELRTNLSKSPIQFVCNVTYVTVLNIGYLSALFVCLANRVSRKLFAQMLRISVHPSYQLCSCYVFRSNSKGTKQIIIMHITDVTSHQ